MLLASYALDRFTETHPGERLAMLTTAVSTQMLESMGSVEGFSVTETLTGFKWLSNVALTLQKEGYKSVYAFEEAIGYMFPDVVCDKDGILAVSRSVIIAHH
jgi:phosphoglucomutase